MIIETIASSSAGCCYLIKSEGEQLLIECGISLKKIREALNFDLSRVVGCLISHEHKDHCKAIQDLSKKTIIELHAPDRVFDGVYRGGVARTIPRMKFTCGEKFLVTAVSLTHDTECFGYIIQSSNDILFYATDTCEVNYTIKGLTHLMIEANYSLDDLFISNMHKTVVARVFENHLSIADALVFAKRHQETLKEVHLIHLSDAHSNEELFKHLAEESLGVPIYISPKGVLK